MSYSRQRGFTIIELMVVMTILGILASLAIPSFTRLMQDNRRTTVVNELMANLLSARAEAAKRGRSVTVCAITGPEDTDCSGTGTNWDKGWILFHDDDGDGTVDTGPPPETITLRYTNDSGLTVRSIITSSIPASNGWIKLNAFNQQGTVAQITVCDKRGAKEARALCVETNGRARISATTCAGAALTCP